MRGDGARRTGALVMLGECLAEFGALDRDYLLPVIALASFRRVRKVCHKRPNA